MLNLISRMILLYAFSGGVAVYLQMIGDGEVPHLDMPFLVTWLPAVLYAAVYRPTNPKPIKQEIEE
jgi:hypothetical protein